MPKQAKPLSARKVESIREPGRYADGGNLYLVAEESGSRHWVFRYRWRDRRREMGLGSFPDIPLIRARELAAEARRQLAAGQDPLEARGAARAVPTFGQMADEVIAAHSPGWRNEKHRYQWRMTLTHYAAPLRDLPVDEVDTDAVLAVLKPLWDTRPETAKRLQGRIEKVLDAAKARRLRSGENPAQWRGNLAHWLPPRKRLTRGHHAALAIDGMPEFMAELRGREGVAALALEFCILTAARSGEVLGAKWSEIDRANRLWVVPRERVKAGREHRVPLSDAAIAILDTVEPLRAGPLVFPGMKPGRPLSSMSMKMALRRMKRGDITVHGFRSTFRDWASEHTDFPHEVCEKALAHTIANKVEAAYRRGDLLERRSELMEAWAAFLAPAEGKVVRLGRRA